MPKEPLPGSQSGSAEGKEVDTGAAKQLPGKGEVTSPPPQPPSIAVPIGQPVSPDEYRRLKAAAEKPGTGEVTSPPEGESPAETVSIGQPVSPDAYRRLKAAAEKPGKGEVTPPPDKDSSAQVDSA